MTVFFLSGLAQNSGAAICASSSAMRRTTLSASKIPPQGAELLGGGLQAVLQLFLHDASVSSGKIRQDFNIGRSG
jgi:hypothetical protein